MSRITPTDEPQYRVGLGGNHYVWCAHRDKVAAIAERIGRSPSSVYWRGEYGVWALRVREKRHKALLRGLFERSGGQTAISLSE